jgi:hypothetical protein
MLFHDYSPFWFNNEPFDFDIDRLRTKPFLSVLRTRFLLDRNRRIDYWLTCAEVAASLMSLAVSFGWDI